jgi:hypothetical protein
MKRVGVCVVNLFFACAIVFSIKTLADTNTACHRYLPEHSTAETTQISSTLIKLLSPEPFMIRYRAGGLPARRIGGYICSKSADSMARDYVNPGGSFANSPDRRSPTRKKGSDAIPG